MTTASRPTSTRPRRWSASAAAALALVLGGCSDDAPDVDETGPSSTPAPTTGDATAPASSSPSPTEKTTSDPPITEPSASVDPAAELIGAWSSTDPGDATFAYRFDDDGTYAWVGVLTQPRTNGTFTITIQASGRYAVDGGRIHLEPEVASRTREDPDDPQGDFTDQPYELEPSSMRWQITRSGALLLNAGNGVQHYQREHS